MAADPPARRRRFARLRGFFRGPEPAAVEPESPQPDEAVDPPSPPPAAAEPAPEPRARRRTPDPRPARPRPRKPRATTPEPPATTGASATTRVAGHHSGAARAAPEPPVTEAALTAALDSLGQAHHRPYSRA